MSGHYTSKRPQEDLAYLACLLYRDGFTSRKD